MLVDAAGLWFRSFYALPESLTAPDGTPVNSVRGFCDMLARLITDRRPGRLIACLDNDWRPQFRVDLLPSYKAHRVAEAEPDEEDVPDSLGPQVPIILEVLAAAGIATAEAEGFEADDVIGTLTEQEQRDPVQVVTGDRDLFQLVRSTPTPARVVYVGAGLAKAQDYGPAELAERYALSADRAGADYADMAILRGDPSDGLPGVAGIGEKTAAKLITQFGSLEALLEAAQAGDRGLTPRVLGKLVEAAEYLSAAPGVVRVARNAPVVLHRPDGFPPSDVDHQRLRQLQQQWGLGSSIDRLISAIERSGQPR
ncbi:5'-3' exonuclease [Saccharopolyspora rectivirgula]|uniref:5'-3' exonuclease n=1 Tax=Saccharopolyspora rectivirgula TaxID=28042 RepID=A0A073AYQ5_9PSEU|nr:5'-3' exonuclease [Saccharopolyspora rectivirgula]KEI44923.1 5'-3' exonuclease [Saccharopolyspora rectivirgula]